MSDPEVSELIDHLSRLTPLSADEARHVVSEIVAYFDEDQESFIRRRHREMQAQGLTNSAIYSNLQGELDKRLFPAAPMSERQIRRMIYG